MTFRKCLACLALAAGAEVSAFAQETPDHTLDTITVSATRTETALDRSPASTTVISADQIDQDQYRFATDALRTVPGLDVVQTGTPGQVTSVFIRGQRSDQTQVLLDGIPFNQGLSGAFNFADLTTDGLARIEAQRGPQSALYGSNASGGVIDLITSRGTDKPAASGFFEGGSYDSFRESAAFSGKLGPVDFAVGASRYDTDNSRPNNNYRADSVLGDVGVSPLAVLRLGLVYYYNYADAGSPNMITAPRPYDNLRTERFLLAPNLEFKPVSWWSHRFYFSYDQERQINNPNDDQFFGPTRGIFRRAQLEYQNNLQPVAWASLISGFYYSHVDVYQQQPEFLFGPRQIRDKSENVAGYAQLKLTPVTNLDLYGGLRYDAFRNYGDRLSYRFAGNYLFAATHTVLRVSFASGVTPPSSQDKIFGGNPNLKVDKDKGFDAGIEQTFWKGRIRLGGNFFYNTDTNVVGFNNQFIAFNLGKARTQGGELFASLAPLPGLTLSANYTYLDAISTSEEDVTYLPGARLPRRPRNAFYGAVSYVWFNRLTTSAEVQTVNARQDLNPLGGPNVNVEDYTVVRLTGRYQVNDWLQIIGRIENLTDEKYAEVLGYPALGRTFYGGFELKF